MTFSARLALRYSVLICVSFDSSQSHLNGFMGDATPNRYLLPFRGGAGRRFSILASLKIVQPLINIRGTVSTHQHVMFTWRPLMRAISQLSYNHSQPETFLAMNTSPSRSHLISSSGMMRWSQKLGQRTPATWPSVLIMAFYVTVDTDLAENFDKKLGQFTICLATPLYFFQDWKAAVLEYGFRKGFAEEQELIHITTDLVESQLICNREERILASLPNPGKIPLFRSYPVPHYKRIVLPQCAKLTFSFINSDGAPVSFTNESTFFYMTLLFEVIWFRMTYIHLWGRWAQLISGEDELIHLSWRWVDLYIGVMT